MFETYQSEEDGKYYWRLKADNGKIVAVGGEGFESKGNAIRAMGTAKRLTLEAVGQQIEEVHAADAEELETAPA
jgi:uncharacterized protein YegP (UPF0339 family)